MADLVLPPGNRNRRDIETFETCSWITDEESLFRVGGHLSFFRKMVDQMGGSRIHRWGLSKRIELYELLLSIYSFLSGLVGKMPKFCLLQ